MSLLGSVTDCCSPRTACIPGSLADLISIAITTATRLFIVTASTYGATGNGTNDDTAAIQAAVTAACEFGGIVYFPLPGKYKLTSQVLVSSKYPVYLLAGGYGYDRFGLSPSSSGILIAGTGAGFRFASPTANRADAGGGAILGMTFRDDTAPSAGYPGTFLTTALDLHDFNFGLVRDCSFWNINGSCIHTDFAIQTNIVNCMFHYSGRAAFPALWVGATSTTYCSQSMVIRDCKLEVIHDAPYIQVDANSSEILIECCGFEADDVAIPATNQNFILDNAGRISIHSCTFNRNTARQVVLAGTQTTLTACKFRGSANATEAIFLSGGLYNSIIGCTFNSGKTSHEISADVAAAGNTISGCQFINSGSIGDLGSGTTVIGCNIIIGFAYNTSPFWIQLSAEGSALSNTIISVAGSAPSGIYLTGTTPRCIGNNISHIDGTAIQCNSQNACIIGNNMHECGIDFDDLASTVNVDLNWMPTTPYLQTAIPNVNPGLIAAGATFSYLVTTGLTRAVKGDWAMAGHTDCQTGIEITASIYANGLVNVFFTNKTGLGITVNNGTLKVWVRKAMV